MERTQLLYLIRLVSAFDGETNLSETLQPMSEILKNECGLELQPASVQDIAVQGLPKYDASFSLKDKLAWIIAYLDTASKNQLIGLKVSNVGTIQYS